MEDFDPTMTVLSFTGNENVTVNVPLINGMMVDGNKTFAARLTMDNLYPKLTLQEEIITITIVDDGEGIRGLRHINTSAWTTDSWNLAN